MLLPLILRLRNIWPHGDCKDAVDPKLGCDGREFERHLSLVEAMCYFHILKFYLAFNKISSRVKVALIF